MMPSQTGGMRLRPMTLGDIIDETIRLYRRHFVTFFTAMGVYAVVQAIFTIAVNLMSVDFNGGRTPSMAQILTLVSIAIPSGILVAIGGLWSSAAVTKLASDAILGRPLDVGAACRFALERTLSLIWAGFLIGLVVVLLGITIIGIPFAIYLGLGWSLVYQAVLIERLGGRAAMRRSSGLVSGYRWRVFAIGLLLTILVSILVSIPTTLVGVATGVSAAVSKSSGVMGIAQVVNSLVSAAAQALFGSLNWITTTVLYYELRVRKEAFDLEQRATDGEPAASLPPA